MKKLLATICALMLMTSFVSCGDTRESSSELSSSVSELTTEEVTTEESAESVTEESTEKEIVLDSKWECDYLTIAKSSEWEETIENEDNEISVDWIWGDETPRHAINLRIKPPSENGKMSKEDLQKKYSKTGLYTIFDSFTTNGQAYIITSLGGEDYIMRNIYFSTDEFDGSFIYTRENEDIVMDMINSIEFKRDVTITKVTTKSTEPTTTAKVKNKKFTFGDLSFELPESCEEHDHEQSENREYFLYELEGPLVLQMTKIFDNSFIDFYYADNETKQFTLENIASSSDTYKDFEKLGEPEIININGEIIAKQEMMTESGSGDIYSTLYVLVYNSDVYTFHFSFLNENDVQSHIMQDKIIESFLFNEDSKISFGEKNALEMAKNYLEIMPFSYNGLIKQLEYEQFTHKEAVYGADNCGADWNQQATDLAQNYIDLMPFSRDELIDQLISEGFTQEQAEYGVSSVGY